MPKSSKIIFSQLKKPSHQFLYDSLLKRIENASTLSSLELGQCFRDGIYLATHEPQTKSVIQERLHSLLQTNPTFLSALPLEISLEWSQFNSLQCQQSDPQLSPHQKGSQLITETSLPKIENLSLNANCNNVTSSIRSHSLALSSSPLMNKHSQKLATSLCIQKPITKKIPKISNATPPMLWPRPHHSSASVIVGEYPSFRPSAPSPFTIVTEPTTPTPVISFSQREVRAPSSSSSPYFLPMMRITARRNPVNPADSNERRILEELARQNEQRSR